MTTGKSMASLAMSRIMSVARPQPASAPSGNAISSSAASYKLAKKNYALFQAELGKALGRVVASRTRVSK